MASSSETGFARTTNVHAGRGQPGAAAVVPIAGRGPDVTRELVGPVHSRASPSSQLSKVGPARVACGPGRSPPDS